MGKHRRFIICIHDIGPRVDRKNETGYKQEQEKEGYRRERKRVESLQLRVCCKLVL